LETCGRRAALARAGDGTNQDRGAEAAAPREGGNHDELVPRVGVDGSEQHTGPDTDSAPNESQEHRFDLELDAGVTSGGPKRAAQADLRAARSSFIGRVKPLICRGFAQVPLISRCSSLIEFPLQPCICCLEI
jgi:hypothetical protein